MRHFPVISFQFSIALALSAVSALAADSTKLPPASNVPIDFSRDIQPILESACLRCHGAVKPKGGLRLDSRDAALRGGAAGLAILPGRSAESRLIHAVARLDAETQMPPTGKGDPLTSEQVGKLRAWIDQGVQWNESALGQPPKIEFSVAPTIRVISVSGNESKFREHTGLRPGVSGGSAKFSFEQQLDPDTRLSLSGRALPRDEDYAVKLSLDRRDVGFVRAEYEQSRRYSDDSGGSYLPFATPSFNTGRELFMDTGRAVLEVGLNLPDVPRVTLGYEYQFRDGALSTLAWGDSTQGGVTRNIYPSVRFVDEKTHILKLDLEHDLHGTRIEDSARVEFYDLSTRKEQASPASGTAGATVAPATFVLVREQASHWQGQNALRLERQLTDWLFGSVGHLYSRMAGEAGFQMNTVTPAGATAASGEQWFANQILLERESHLFSASMLAGPWSNLTFSGAVQSEWTRQTGLGDENLRILFFGFPIAIPVAVSSQLDVRTATEQFGLRYTGIPHTALYADGRFQQESRGVFEQQTGGAGFVRRTDADAELRDLRAGFHASPWSDVSLSANYRRHEKRTDYANLEYTPPGGPYPGFLRQRASYGDEVDARLSWRAASWWKMQFGYRLAATDYVTATDAFPGLPAATPGGALYSANHDSHTFSLGHTLTPFRRWSFNASASYTDSRASSAQNGVPSVVPWRGGIVSAQGAATFAWTETTDLRLSHAWSRADYAQNNFVSGLPAGLEYDQHSLQVGLTKRMPHGATMNVQYGFHRYTEPPSGSANDYSAHSILGTLMLKWPEK